MKWTPLRQVLFAGGFLGAIGCDAGLNTTAATRDSSGVWIVESRVPAWSDGEAWTIAAEPTLQIGNLEGDPDYQFFRIEAAVWLPDGGIAVANGGTADIKAFDQSGNYRWTRGGRGDAPGEYRLITGLGTGPGDSLWVYDFGLRRFTVLTTTGEVVWTVSVGASLSATNAVGRFPDGFRLLDIRDDAVLGVWRDESEVQYIRVYPLEKPLPQLR